MESVTVVAPNRNLSGRHDSGPGLFVLGTGSSNCDEEERVFAARQVRAFLSKNAPSVRRVFAEVPALPDRVDKAGSPHRFVDIIP
jgi:hypothetical protein